jgi:Domain of unknown function (DUF4386)
MPASDRHIANEADMTDIAARQVPVDSMRRTALVAGVLYLITFIAGIPPAAFLLGPVLNDPNYIVSAGADTQVLFGAFLDLVTALACIGTAVALYSVVKRQHEGFALAFVTTRLFEAAIIVIGVISIIAVVALRQAGAAGGEAATLVTVGRALVAVRDGAHLLGPGVIPGLNALLLGYLMYRSRLVPRLIPAMGLVGAPLFLVAVTALILGFDEQALVLYGIAVVPVALWELSLGLWLVFRGFNQSAPILAAPAVEAAAPDPSAAPPSRVTVTTEAGGA